MLQHSPQSKLGKILQKAETKLILFFVGVAYLAYIGIVTGSIKTVIFSYLTFTAIIGLIYFWREILLFFLAPIGLIIWPIQILFLRRHLKKNAFKQNIHARTVVVLGHPNWFMLEGWLNPIFFANEIKQLVKTMKAEGRDFSFYQNANLDDVEKIMVDKSIEEVYFLGHGNSHSFQLGTDEILYYCEFNNPKYTKQFVHQVHCGTKYGKSLIDYVVPIENRDGCFFFREAINSPRIVKELKRREGLALSKYSDRKPK